MSSSSIFSEKCFKVLHHPGEPGAIISDILALKTLSSSKVSDMRIYWPGFGYKPGQTLFVAKRFIMVFEWKAGLHGTKIFCSPASRCWPGKATGDSSGLAYCAPTGQTPRPDPISHVKEEGPAPQL